MNPLTLSQELARQARLGCSCYACHAKKATTSSSKARRMHGRALQGVVT